MLASEWVLVLLSALLLPLEPVSLWVLVLVTRFHFLPEAKAVVLFVSHPPLTVLTQWKELKALWVASHCSLIFRSRDLPRHSAKPSFPGRARFALLNSSELILRSAQRARVQLA